jgi:squalene-hopene/tetraprenyl-beta-curcumene cyclase
MTPLAMPFARLLFCCLLTFWLFSLGSNVAAAEPVKLATVKDPGKISGDEPLAKSFSPAAAARYMDTASLHWQKSRKCAACHTNMGHLFARPALGDVAAESGEVRKFYEEYVTKRWSDSLPRQGVYAVVVAAGLAWNDAQTSGRLEPTTRKALEIMWKTQREAGDWKWLLCGWPPMESDSHYGATLAAVTVGIAPEDYAKSTEAKEGLQRIRKFFKANPPLSFHHRVMLAWASVRVAGLMTDSERESVLKELLDTQRPDGGWATPQMFSTWDAFKRKDDLTPDLETSDAYGTGFAIVVCRELGLPANDVRLRQGVRWLKSNQRASGKWYTASPTKDSRHYMSNFGTAFAVLGLQACGELPGWPFAK